MEEWTNYTFRKANGLWDDAANPLFADYCGRIWVVTDRRVAYFQDGRFAAVTAVRGGEVLFMTEDKAVA